MACKVLIFSVIGRVCFILKLYLAYVYNTVKVSKTPLR